MHSLSPPISDKQTTYAEVEWQRLAQKHSERVKPLLDAYRERRKHGESHPVYDFLFTYYRTPRHHLEKWRPALHDKLLGESAKEQYGDLHGYSQDEEGVFLDPLHMTPGERQRVIWIEALLKRASERPPRFACYGLHEWAMVYKTHDIRHSQVPLRLPLEQINQIVENSAITCSHYDAYRFFTEAARPLNEFRPEKSNRNALEQFGCVHFNMDLYKRCYQLSPWIGSELMYQCFSLATDARKLDMRASPYDLSAFGFSPITIETPEGKAQYQKEQYALYRRGQPLAQNLIQICGQLLSAESCL